MYYITIKKSFKINLLSTFLYEIMMAIENI